MVTDAERERQIAFYAAQLQSAWLSGKRAEAKLIARVHAGLIRGRSRDVARRMEIERGLSA